MGNCFVLSKQEKVLRVVKTDGKVLEFRAPTLVMDLLMNLSGSGISVSKQASELLPPNYKLKLGKVYYMIPLLGSVASHASSAGIISSVDVTEKDRVATRRIKIVIKKQQLQELLTKQISAQEVLSASGIEQKSCSFNDSSTNWKPKLESIPELEGSEERYFPAFCS